MHSVDVVRGCNTILSFHMLAIKNNSNSHLLYKGVEVVFVFGIWALLCLSLWHMDPYMFLFISYENLTLGI